MSFLSDTLREAARRFGERSALVDETGWSIGYAELDAVAEEVAAGLAGQGVGPGEVVAIMLPAGPAHVAAYLGIARRSAVAAAVNARLSPPERAAVLSIARPVMALTTASLLGEGLPAGCELRLVEDASGADSLLDSLRRRGQKAPEPERGHPAAIVFTSGSTGVPKGAVFGDRQIGFIADTDVGESWGGGGPVQAGSVLAHLGPMTKLAGALRRGSTQHFLSRWEAAAALEMIDRHRMPVVAGVPAQIALMMRDPAFESTDLTSVRAVIMGGGPATPSLVRDARRRFGAPVATRYSCTEAGIGTGTGFTDPEEDAEQTVGRPQPGVHVAIVDEAGAEVARGDVGEVCLSSAAVMDGYWQDPAASAAAFTTGGAVRSGDLGWIDPSGRLHLAGRARERYVRGGFNVHPMEVEAVLAGHEDVAAVAVVPRADPVMGEVGVAVVVPRRGRPPPELAALRGFASKRLAGYKLPDELIVVEALPLTAMDKIDRRALEAMVISAAGECVRR